MEDINIWKTRITEKTISVPQQRKKKKKEAETFSTSPR